MRTTSVSAVSSVASVAIEENWTKPTWSAPGLMKSKKVFAAVRARTNRKRPLGSSSPPVPIDPELSMTKTTSTGPASPLQTVTMMSSLALNCPSLAVSR